MLSPLTGGFSINPHWKEIICSTKKIFFSKANSSTGRDGGVLPAARRLDFAKYVNYPCRASFAIQTSVAFAKKVQPIFYSKTLCSCSLPNFVHWNQLSRWMPTFYLKSYYYYYNYNYYYYYYYYYYFYFFAILSIKSR
jgi:hypothetical protein